MSRESDLLGSGGGSDSFEELAATGLDVVVDINRVSAVEELDCAGMLVVDVPVDTLAVGGAVFGVSVVEGAVTGGVFVLLATSVEVDWPILKAIKATKTIAAIPPPMSMPINIPFEFAWGASVRRRLPERRRGGAMFVPSARWSLGEANASRPMTILK